MFGLGEKIGGDESGYARCGEDDSFGGTGREVDRAIAADELLCGGNRAIAGTEDLIYTWNTLCAVGQRGDGLRAADMSDFFDTKEAGCRQEFGVGLGADD